MIHARPDYNRMGHDPALDDSSLLTEGSTPIAEDEPVTLFRAQDKHYVGVMEDYKARLLADPTPPAPGIIDSIDSQIARALLWQVLHAPKSPDL